MGGHTAWWSVRTQDDKRSASRRARDTALYHDRAILNAKFTLTCHARFDRVVARLHGPVPRLSARWRRHSPWGTEWFGRLVGKGAAPLARAARPLRSAPWINTRSRACCAGSCPGLRRTSVATEERSMTCTQGSITCPRPLRLHAHAAPGTIAIRLTACTIR